MYFGFLVISWLIDIYVTHYEQKDAADIDK
jgi:hypothetical protein